MALAVVLVLLMDDTLLITPVITGDVFVFSAPEMASDQAGALPWS